LPDLNFKFLYGMHKEYEHIFVACVWTRIKEEFSWILRKINLTNKFKNIMKIISKSFFINFFEKYFIENFICIIWNRKRDQPTNAEKIWVFLQIFSNELNLNHANKKFEMFAIVYKNTKLDSKLGLIFKVWIRFKFYHKFCKIPSSDWIKVIN
jgi:hypothetical protein